MACRGLRGPGGRAREGSSGGRANRLDVGRLFFFLPIQRPSPHFVSDHDIMYSFETLQYRASQVLARKKRPESLPRILGYENGPYPYHTVHGPIQGLGPGAVHASHAACAAEGAWSDLSLSLSQGARGKGGDDLESTEYMGRTDHQDGLQKLSLLTALSLTLVGGTQGRWRRGCMCRHRNSLIFSNWFSPLFFAVQAGSDLVFLLLALRGVDASPRFGHTV